VSLVVLGVVANHEKFTTIEIRCAAQFRQGTRHQGCPESGAKSIYHVYHVRNPSSS